MKIRSLVIALLNAIAISASAAPAQLRLESKLFVFDQPQFNRIKVSSSQTGQGAVAVVAPAVLHFGDVDLNLSRDSATWSTGTVPTGITSAEVPNLVTTYGKPCAIEWSLPTQYFEKAAGGYALRTLPEKNADGPHWKMSFRVTSIPSAPDGLLVSVDVEWAAIERREKLEDVDLDVGKPIITTARRNLEFRSQLATWSAVLLSPPNNSSYGALLVIRVVPSDSPTVGAESRPAASGAPRETDPRRRLYVQAVTSDKGAFDHWRRSNEGDLFYDALSAASVKESARQLGFQSIDILPYGSSVPTDAPVVRLNVSISTEAGGYSDGGNGGAGFTNGWGVGGGSTPPPPPQPRFVTTYLAAEDATPIDINPTGVSALVVRDRTQLTARATLEGAPTIAMVPDIGRVTELRVVSMQYPTQAYFISALHELRRYLDAKDSPPLRRLYVQISPELSRGFDRWRSLTSGGDFVYEALRIGPDVARREGFQDVVVLPAGTALPTDAPIMVIRDHRFTVSYLANATATPADLGAAEEVDDEAKDEAIKKLPREQRKLAGAKFEIVARFVSDLRKVRAYVATQPH